MALNRRPVQEVCWLCNRRKSNLSRRPSALCLECDALLVRQMRTAWQHFAAFTERHDIVDYGVYRGQFAPNLWCLYRDGASVYQWPEHRTPGELYVDVTPGVVFYEDRCRPCYQLQFNNATQLEEYEPIPYTLDLIAELEAALGDAAWIAWNDEIATCPRCGWHYHRHDGCRCEQYGIPKKGAI
jgi:hypothetical protein